MRVLIVGAGIAGLSLGIALRRIGADAELVDVTEDTEGASIGLTGRAVDVLAELGVLDACAAAGRVLGPGRSVFDEMRDEYGNRLVIPGPPGPPRPPAPPTGLPSAITIYRPELARILRAAADDAGASRRVGPTVEALRQDADGVDVTFTDGTTGRYDLVVGADGVRSTVRRLIHGEEIQPIYTGHMSLRWILRDGPDGEPGFYTRTGGMVAIAPLPGGVTYLATGLDMPNERVDPATARQLLRDALAPYPAPYLQALRDAVTEDQVVLARPFEWLLVPEPWHRGRVTVIGDAAHATTALLSSGGGMALEDAAVLAQELAAASTPEKALDAFMTRRLDRVRTVVEVSVQLLEMQTSNADQRAIGAARGRALGLLAQPY